MKLIFFLVAFFLVSIRVFFSWSGKDREKRGISESSLVIRGDHFFEELKYSGKFILTDDESGFKSISPGGHIKFTLNDEVVKAESNLQGKIAYSIYDGRQYLQPDDTLSKRMITEAIHQMIYWGFDAEPRLDRVYKKGGMALVLNELDSMKTDYLKSLYITRLFSVDSLSREYGPMVILKINSLGSDRDKVLLLEKIPTGELSRPAIAEAYFSVLSGLESDPERSSAIQHLMEGKQLSDSNKLKMILLVGQSGSDFDKKNLYESMIERHLIDSLCYDTLLLRISHLSADFDKTALYNKLIDEQPVVESQWISLIQQVSTLGSDIEKTEVLVHIAQKSPGTSGFREAYLAAAKTIHDDYNYGRVLRAIH